MGSHVFVCVTYATHHLPRCHAHRLDAELAPAHIEEVLQTGAQEVDDKDVVQALLSEVMDGRDTDCALVSLDELVLGSEDAPEPARMR